MDAEFWHDRWARNEIGFHEGRPNARLTAHLAALNLAPGARIFLPLCGKTRDIAWLLAQGFRVAGAELSERAITQLFAELGVTPDVTPAGPLRRFSAPGIDIFVGDIFGLTRDLLGAVDAIYDRAALVALPPGLRPRYAAHLSALTGAAPQLLICFAYDQSLMDGPPFSVPAAEVAALYAGVYAIRLLERQELAGGLRGQPARDEVWRLG